MKAMSGALVALCALAALLLAQDAAGDADVIAKVAKEYYAVLDALAAKEKVAAERDHAAVWNRAYPVGKVATGEVANRRGEPVAGAKVRIETEGRDRFLGEGVTDEKGRFRADLADDRYRGLTVEVTAEGYGRWAQGGIYGGIVDHPVRMDRKLDEAFFKALAAEKDPERRLWLLLEVIGPRQFGSVTDEVFGWIGAMQNDLRRIAQSREFDRGEDPPALEACRLLAMWFDPQDDSLIASAIKDERFKKAWIGSLRPLIDRAHADAGKPERSDKTIEEILRKINADIEADKKRPPYDFGKPVMDPDESRALVFGNVYYAIWGYSEMFIFVRRNGEWHLMTRSEYQRWDRKPEE